jgi:regulatory protein YycI of two-component signal transduction system YycFG
MEKIVTPPPVNRTESKKPQSSNKVLIVVLIIIGIIMTFLAVDYFMGKDGTKQEEKIIKNPEAETLPANNLLIDSASVSSIPSDNSTLKEVNEVKVTEQPSVSHAAPEISEKKKPVNNVQLNQLNDLLNQIANSDDNATDKIRSVLGNSLRVEGAPNISNVQQLITDVSNGNHYKVTKVNTNADGKIISINVSK